MPNTLRQFLRLTVATVALTVAPCLAHAQSINLPDNDVLTSPFGKGAPGVATATYGQTFTTFNAPTFLQTFSFWLSNDAAQALSNTSSLRFQAYVMQWDAANGMATGPVLFSSSVQTGPTLQSQRYDFSTSNTQLASNTQYVAFLSVSGLFSSIGVSDATAAMETTLSGTYIGGQFVFFDNGDDFSALTTTPWDLAGGFPEYQSHFEANFTDTVVPEPSSLILLASGFAVLMLVTHKRRRA